MNKNDLIKSFDTLKKAHEQKVTELNLKKKDAELKKSAIAKLMDEQRISQLQKEILLSASEKGRESGRQLFEAVATEAVKTILGDEYSVALNTSVKNGVPWCNVSLQAKYGDVIIETDPVEEDSGGRSDCISLSFFIVLRMLAKTMNRAPQFIDEGLKSLSDNYGKEASVFLKELIELSDTQTFIITHEKDYLPAVADKSYGFEQIDGVTRSTLLR